MPETKPLSGKRVVVTRATDQASGFAEMLVSAGAEVVEFPTIQTVPPESYDEVDRAVGELAGFDFVVFTSANAVKFFFRRLAELGKDARGLSGMKVVAVGPKTAAELMANGLEADIVPREFKAEGVIEALRPFDMSGKRVLFPRAEVAREVLPEKLREMGAEVVLAVVYRTVLPKADAEHILRLFREGGVSALTFTSSSTVRNFMAMAGDGVREHIKGVCVACIGPVTAQTCKELGLPVTVVPEDYTVDALLGALTEYFGRRK